MDNKPISILHVEDDTVDAMVMQRALKKCEINHMLFHAGNGIEALDMLRGTNGKSKIDPAPKIILLDLNMPKMNGIEFLRELRADQVLKAISVFVMTTSNDETDKSNAFSLNVAGYLLKPLSLESYVSVVTTLNDFWKLTELSGSLKIK